MRSRPSSALASRLIPAILLASAAVLSGQKTAPQVDPAGPPRAQESELRDLVRARLMQTKLPRDYDANWKYAGDIKPGQR